MQISTSARSITPSMTIGMDDRARRLRRQGVDIVSFAAGEPDFDTPEVIKRAAVKAIQEGFTKYTSPAGIKEVGFMGNKGQATFQVPKDAIDYAMTRSKA